ncbi:ion transporter [Capnocytophaga sp. ARDL2]|uniref:ion transporter n=1 Tax=Capnocytophaga sp. ARDL2 TaxID=3238809 RepID=UPI003555DF20
MKRLKSKNELLKQKIYIIIYGTGTVAGRLFDIILLGVILFSMVLVMLESIEQIDSKYHNLLIYGEYVITIFFTIEYFLRIYSNKKPLSYIFSFYGLIDLLALLPMYLSVFIPNTSFLITFRALRLLRIFVIFDMIPILNQQWQLKEALKQSKNKILVFIYFMMVISVVLGTLMFMIEGKENGFVDIPTSIYWCIVTMTTVGYGDLAPTTGIGQFLASIIMIMGYGIIAVPTGIVTSEYGKLNKKEKKNKVQCTQCFKKIKQHNYCPYCGTKIIEKDTCNDTSSSS